MEIAVLVGAKAAIGYTAITIGTWESSPPAPKVLSSASFCSLRASRKPKPGTCAAARLARADEHDRWT
jgi:hypothetical protein